jgi:drug/metabolite transporter (DMT)-like permease
MVPSPSRSSGDGLINDSTSGPISPTSSPAKSSNRRNAIRAIVITVALVIVVITWVAEAELVQGLQEPDSEVYFPNPYALNWAIGAGYNLAWPLWLILRFIRARVEQNNNKNTSDDGVSSPSSSKSRFFEPLRSDERRLLKHGVWLEVLFATSGYCWYYSLPRTSVAGNTIIYNLTPVFVLPFSMVVLRERATVAKVAAVLLCMVGMVAVALDSAGQKIAKGERETWDGYLMVALSMISYAIFDVMFAKFVEAESSETTRGETDTGSGNEPTKPASHSHSHNQGEEEPLLIQAHTEQQHSAAGNADGDDPSGGLTGASNLLLFTAWSGLVNAVLLWPGIWILSATGVEPFEMPGWPVMRLILINICLDLSLNISYLLVRCVFVFLLFFFFFFSFLLTQLLLTHPSGNR